MNRSLVPLLLCAVLALVAAPALAPGQEVERPPTKLWDEFPLEPSATPATAPTSEATSEATPTTRVVEVPGEDGMATAELIALIIGASGIGAIAAHFALRKLPRAPARAAAVQTSGTRTAKPTAAPLAFPPAATRDLEQRLEREREEKQQLEQRLEREREEKQQLERGLEQEREEKQQLERGLEQEQAQRAEAQQKQQDAERTRRAAPAAEPPSPSPHPRPAPSQPAGRRFTPSGGLLPTPGRCAITLAKRPPLGRFVAIDDGSGQVVARSPVFKLKRAPGEDALRPPDALQTLVDELTAAGWHKTGTGRSPWELQFELPAGALMRHASPPRA